MQEPPKIEREHIIKLMKSVGLISSGTLSVILVYALTGRLSPEHAGIALIAIWVSTTFFIHPYISNITALTDYVKKLAQDKKPEEPDLSFLNDLGQLSAAVEELQHSWDSRRNQLEAALAENKIVIEVLPDALFILDKEMKIIRTNGMARYIFGPRIIFRRLEEILPVTDLINAVENVKQVKEVEFSILDGEIKRDYLAKVTKFPANYPSQTDTIVTLHDLTLMKQIRKMQSDFVANASHEMKTPLASIMGLVETIQTTAKNDPEAQADFLRIVGDQAFRMKTLIEDLLSLSKIEADTTAPETKVDIVKIVSDAKKHVEWAASQRNVNVQIDVKAEIPLVLGDENQLSQVFINLISNAIKYGFPDSEVLVELKISRKLPIEMNDRFDKAVEISVMDHSEGIPPEHIPRLTERFYRVDSGRSKKMGGTGLGLAIVKHIINRHNGALDIKSKVGVGSTFSVYLPIRDPSL